MHSSLSPEVPCLPTGAGARDIAIAPPVCDCGLSVPVVGSIGGLELSTGAGEPDPATGVGEPDGESGALGCTTQPASGQARTTVATPSRIV